MINKSHPGSGQLQLKPLIESETGLFIVRGVGWSTLTVLFVFFVNNTLNVWFGWPGAMVADEGRSYVQAGFYAVAIVGAFLHVYRNPERPLRFESKQISDANTFLIRACFWAVLIVGLVDMFLSLLEVEQLLKDVFGEAISSLLVQQKIRGPYVHMPLIGVSIVMAAYTRTLGFPWLALLIVAAELTIVMFRFIFSYEQVYMTDLVRFWYASLFLFACAYTLREEGHVRVDVFYAGFARKTKALVNAVGSLIFGMPLCWVLLTISMKDQFGIVNSALTGFEKTNTGYGMYVQYLMTVLLAVFAVSMLIQFVSYLFSAVADYREAEFKPSEAHKFQVAT